MTIQELEALVERIKSYLTLLNSNIEQIEKEQSGLVDFIIYETIDRICLYLNSQTIPLGIERMIAQIVNSMLKHALDSQNGSDNAIASINDNGQSISYANEVKKYFTVSTDEELFSGFESVLKRYRRLKVVTPK